MSIWVVSCNIIGMTIELKFGNHAVGWVAFISSTMSSIAYFVVNSLRQQFIFFKSKFHRQCL